MQPDTDTLLDRARSAAGDELKALLHETRGEVLLALLENPQFEEPHVVLLLDRLDLSAELLTAVAGVSKWKAAEAIRLRLAGHPRTPKRIALEMVRHLFLFDLVRLALLPSAPADIRRVAEELIVARVPHLPVGQKLTLARRGPARVAGALLAEGHAQALKLALDNAFLNESQVLKVLATRSVPERVVAAIGHHAKWSCQYNVRIGLLRSLHPPISAVRAFLPDFKLQDLLEIVKLEELSPYVRKSIEAELVRRAREKE
jgi:hypothetical protein